MKNLAIVLSGGGSRGAYQIGTWQALCALNLQPHIHTVTGCSIGIINGAFMALDRYDDALYWWTNTRPEQLFPALSGRLPDKPANMQLSDYWLLVKDYIKHKGIRIDYLKDLLRELFDEDELRNAGIHLGMTVYNRSQWKGEDYFLRDIPEGLLHDFMIASASFPVFQAHTIQGKKYLDGGFHDVLPIDLAFKQPDVEHVISSDVTAMTKLFFMRQRWKKKYGDRLTAIASSDTLPMPWVFDRAAMEKQIDMGCKDALLALRAC